MGRRFRTHQHQPARIVQDSATRYGELIRVVAKAAYGAALFIMERLSKLPTRQELALRPLLVIAGSAGVVIAWIELFRRVCL